MAVPSNVPSNVLSNEFMCFPSDTVRHGATRSDTVRHGPTRFTGSWLWRAGTWKGCLRLPGPRSGTDGPFQATVSPSRVGHVLGHAALGNWPDVSALRCQKSYCMVQNIFKTCSTHFQTQIPDASCLNDDIVDPLRCRAWSPAKKVWCCNEKQKGAVCHTGSSQRLKLRQKCISFCLTSVFKTSQKFFGRLPVP